MLFEVLDGVADVCPECASVELTKDMVAPDVEESRIKPAKFDVREASLLLNELEAVIESYLPALDVICGIIVVRIDEYKDWALSVDIVLLFQSPKDHNAEFEAEDTVSVEDSKEDTSVIGDRVDEVNEVEAETNPYVLFWSTTKELLDNASLEVDIDGALVAPVITVVKVVLVEDAPGLIYDRVSTMVELLGIVEGTLTEVDRDSELRAWPDETIPVAFELISVVLDKPKDELK